MEIVSGTKLGKVNDV